MKKTAETMTEKAWSEQFKQLFSLLGYEGYHPYLSIHSPRGFPDWTLVNEAQGRLVFVELKTDAKTSKLSPHQVRWHGLLRATGAEVYTWRPSDFEEAARVLSRRREERDD